MQIELLNDQGQSASKFDAPETLFGRDYNEDLIHQIVVAYQANARQGTRAQKDREQVKHSTKKPFKQKGTGRARAGMTSSPIWRGGGRAFPNSPEENFTQKNQQEDVPRWYGVYLLSVGARRPPGCGRFHQNRSSQNQIIGGQAQSDESPVSACYL